MRAFVGICSCVWTFVQHVQVVMGTLTNGFSFYSTLSSSASLCITAATSQVFGLLVWTLIAGTEYFRVPAFGWVMFVAVFYWVLTVFFLIVYITMTYTRIPQVPWTTVVSLPRGLHLLRAMRWDSSVFLWIQGHLCSHRTGPCWRSQWQQMIPHFLMA